MTKTKLHRKVQKGDVLYIPLNYDAFFLRDGEGQYIQNENDIVSFAQVIQEKHGGMLLALYKGLYSQDEVANLNYKEIINGKPSAIYETNTNGLTKGWWPFVCNLPIPDITPYQTYYRSDGVLMNWEESVEIDYEEKIHKKIKFIEYGISGTSGVIREIARGINGLSTKWQLEYEEFTPNLDAVTWKILPES